MQVVHLVVIPTRGSVILDLIATNLHNLYEKPYILAPLSTSDHNIVHWLPLTKDATNTLTPKPKPIKHLVRRYPRSGIEVF